MRDSVTLVEGMENVKILLQYLYLDEGNLIIVKNVIDVPLKLSMDEAGNFECINMNFPDLPPMKNYDFLPSVLETLRKFLSRLFLQLVDGC